ncbi:porin [Candidatus Pelagibacter sp.]|jgi:outer membrane protein OmpU|nr:porin [Candidatus Pelagibacter sp.]
MTNLKKLGLTALAGSLVATTGYAGSLGLSGAAKVSYTSGDTSEVSGNPFSMTRDVSMTGSGELDNGMTISYVQTLTAAAFSSSSLTLDMGDAGSMTFTNGTSGGHGISAYEDKMPSANEQVWDDLDGEANGVLTGNKTNKIGYGTSFAGANVSVDYNKQQGGGSGRSIGIDMSPVDGAMIFVAQSDEYAGPNASLDQVTFGGTYTTGGITAGIQMTAIDNATVNTDQDRTHIAASFAVNEDLSVSWGMSTVEFEGGNTDQEDSGFSASYTMGSMSLTASFNSSDNVGGTSGTDDEHKEIGLAFAF